MLRRAYRRRGLQLRAFVSLLLASMLMPWPVLGVPSAAAAPVPASEAPASPAVRSKASSVTVSVTKPSVSLTPTGTLQYTVTSSADGPVRELRVRIRVRRPTGKLMYQRTEERYGVKAGAVAVDFSRPLKDFSPREGRYSVEMQVEADSLKPVTVTDRLYVVKPGRQPLAVAVVGRFDPTPMVDPEGRFVIDPAQNTATRDEVVALAGLVERMTPLSLTVGIPPIVLEEWRRVTAGYKTIGPEGERTVGSDGPVPASYASALSTLGRVARDPRFELLDVPFADPDLAGLRSMGAVDDLASHYAHGVSVMQASLGATPSAGTAVLGDGVPAGALPVLEKQRITHVLLKPSALRASASRATTQPPGVYSIRESGIRALVIDERASAALSERGASTEDLLDHLFAQLLSGKDRPVVASVRLGPGAGTDVTMLESRLRDLAETGWIRFQTTEQVMRGKPIAQGQLQPTAYPGRPAPPGYWSGLTESRRYADAFVSAVSIRDDEAAYALYAALVAESRCWAGPDNRWAFADRGRAFADAAMRASRDVLDRVSVTTQTITLSGSSGKVPLSVKNGSDKTLQVEIVASSSGARFPSGGRVKATLRPADNYLTVPVDLGSGGVYEDVQVQVVSGGITLASTTIGVRASYLDRLVIIGTVVIVLVVLLFYIRRKVRAAEADT